VTTDASGRATAMFVAGGANGTATITAVSGGATTGANGGLKISVGTAAVARVVLSANPQSVSSLGGSSTITATVLDINGNPLIGSPVQLTTTAGSLSAGTANTDANGVATTVLTTTQTATVTASVGAQGSSSSGTGTGSGSGSGGSTTTTSGTATAQVTVNVRNAPSIAVKSTTTPIFKGVAASFDITVTPPAANGSSIREIKVNWGDGVTDILGTSPGTQTSQHIFTNDGTFVVTATVTDASGDANSSSATVSVVNLPKASVLVTPTPSSGAAPLSVSFAIAISGLPSGVSLRSVSISYGDGLTDDLGAAASVTAKAHTYTVAGTYKATVSAVDTAGQVSEGSTIIVVN
jgi:adhesin/invasin